MNSGLTRRDAIRLGIGAIAAGVIGSGAPAQTRPSASPMRAFVTDRTGRRHERYDEVLRGGTNAPDVIFSIDPQRRMQSILGFGAAFTEAACTVLNRLPARDRAALFDDLFNPSKTNFSLGRLCVGASDYSTELYSYDEGEPDPSLVRFSIDHDRVAVIPVLKEARAIRKDLFLFSSPWSPPGWMKYGGSMKGGCIHPWDRHNYANYILRYLQEYAAAGVPVDAMTIQNEIDADEFASMPACIWSEEIEAGYIVDSLGPVLARSNVHPQVWILDHNYNLWGRVLDQLANPSLRKLVTGVAWHGYAGTPEQMMLVRQRHPDIDMHWTEGGDDITSPTLTTAWARWAKQFAGILNNGAQSITCWNLALDEAGKPNIGPFHCGGMITVNSKTQEITRNGIFWALSHYARAMPRGSHILACTPNATAPITAAAARRPDDSVAIVLTNPGTAARVQIDRGKGSRLNISLTPDSVTTVVIAG